jgi:hypothetical protein
MDIGDQTARRALMWLLKRKAASPKGSNNLAQGHALGGWMKNVNKAESLAQKA